MKLNGREKARITIDKLLEITKIKINKGKKFDSIDGCEDLIKEILDKYTDRKNYVLINELNKEIALQRNMTNLYKEQVDEAVKKIKKLETELAETDNSKALYKEIDSLKEEIEILTKANFDLTIKNQKLEENNLNNLKKVIEVFRENVNLKSNLELHKWYTKTIGLETISIILFIIFIIFIFWR